MHTGKRSNNTINFVQFDLTNLANLRYCLVEEPIFWIVDKAVFMAFQCDK